MSVRRSSKIKTRFVYCRINQSATFVKILRLLLLFSLPFSGIFAQCPAPDVLNWQFTGVDSVTITADFPEGTVAYELKVAGFYTDLQSIPADTLTLTEGADPGIAVLGLDPSSLVQPGYDPATIYYLANLRIQCSSGGWSEPHGFYFSPFSLLNTLNIGCDHSVFSIAQTSSSLEMNTYSGDIEVEEGDTALFVEDISLFIDFYTLGDQIAFILFISPSGTVIVLQDFIPLGWTNLISTLYTDSGEPNTGAETSGVLAPSDPLSAFIGEPAAGTWTIILQGAVSYPLMLLNACLNINSTPCESSASGKAFYDFNANGVQDDEEPAFSHAPVVNTLDNSVFFTSSVGMFNRCGVEGPYNFALAETPLWYISTPESLNIDVAPGESLAGLDFALVPDGEVIDLNVDMFSTGVDRPGFSNSYVINCTNQGNTCVDNVTLEAELDALLTVTGVAGGESSAFSANTVTAELGTLCPLASVSVQVYHTLPDTVALGTALQSSVTLLPTEGDGNAQNNTANLTTEVVGSYDPNDKQVNKTEIDESFTENEEYLYYHIRFQNTGTFYAEFVIISDTIDDLLDFSTFELLDVSHNVELSNEGRKIDFTFNNIFLPDSTTDFEGSQGFVRFRMKPKPEFLLGDTISNTAHIFFDFNEAIITNTVTTVWSEVLSTTAERLVPGVFPNPSASVLNVRMPGAASAASYAVYTLAGKRVKQGRIADGERAFSLSTEGLAPGVYLLHLEGDAHYKPVKWVKM